MNVKVTGLDHHGRGIAHIDGKIVFINDALVDEVVNIKIDEDNKNYMEAHVVEYIEKSPKRVKSKCPYFGVCGGCQLRHMSYEDTIKFKKDKIKNIFKKYADIDIEPLVIKNKNKDFYRNKIELKVKNGIYGFYKKGSHDIVEVDRCLNAEESINVLLRSTNLLNIMNGEIVIKCNYIGEVILDITSQDINKIDIERLREKIKLVGIIYNKKLVFGTDHFMEIISDYTFKETYDSFFQINRYINEELFKIIDDNIEPGDIVVDMCSGVGTLSIVAASKASKVYSLEIVSNAVKDGIINAMTNKKDNIEFIEGDAYSNIQNIKEDIDTYIIDPPRSGLNEKALRTLLEQRPKKIIYVSCDPVTLSRDLKVLSSSYDLNRTYLLDMFSYTYHVESLCLLSLKNNF